MLDPPISPSPEEHQIFVSKPLHSIAQNFQFDLAPLLSDLISQRSTRGCATPFYCPIPDSLRSALGASNFIITLEQNRLYCQLLTGEKWNYSENVVRDFSLSLNYTIPRSSEFTLTGRRVGDLVSGLDFLGDEKITGLDFPNESSNEPIIVFIEPIWIEKKYP